MVLEKGDEAVNLLELLAGEAIAGCVGEWYNDRAIKSDRTQGEARSVNGMNDRHSDEGVRSG